MDARRRRAYTLMEVMLVMAILVTVAAIGFPTVDALYEGVKQQAAVDTVRSAWREAQARAINEGRPYRFAIVPGQSHYRVAPDTAEYWMGEGSSSFSNEEEDPPLVMVSQLPKGVVFQGGGSGSSEGVDSAEAANGTSFDAPPDPASWTNIVVFLPDGTARDDVEMSLHMNGCRPYIVRLRGLTGSLTVQRGG